MRFRNGLCFLGASLVLAGVLGAGQDDVKQRAIEQMRQIANAIKACPVQITSSQDDCMTYRNYTGPPANVEWDVSPSKTVRSPFQGIVEFTLPVRAEDNLIDVSNQSKAIRKKCAYWASGEAALTAQAQINAAKGAATWHDGHYRYEFDVGSDAPELVKMLWVVKDKDNNIVTSIPNSGPHDCWVVAAKSGGVLQSRPAQP